MNAYLVDDVAQYVARASIRKVTADQYDRCVRCFSKFLERRAKRTDLRCDRVNAWLAHLSDAGYSCFTVYGRKRGITPVWNWLSSRKLVPRYDERELRVVRLVYPPVQAWTVEDVQALLQAADLMPGTLRCGMPTSALMRAYLMLAYETGLRPIDLEVLQWSAFRGNQLAIVQHKTGQPHTAYVSDGTLDALEKIQGYSKKVFALKKSAMLRRQHQLFKIAEQFGFRRQKGVAGGTLRKTHGTEVCRIAGLPTSAQSLGHSSGTRIARQSYCEASAIQPANPIEALSHVLAQKRAADTRRRSTA